MISAGQGSWEQILHLQPQSMLVGRSHLISSVEEEYWVFIAYTVVTSDLNANFTYTQSHGPTIAT